MTRRYQHSGCECCLDLRGLSVTKEFYTIAEMAELLRVRPGTIRNRLWLRACSLPPSTVIGRRRLFPLAQYEGGSSSCLSQPPDT